MSRIPIIAGNWKMNMTSLQAIELVNGIRYGLKFPGNVDVVVAPTFLCLKEIANLLKDSYIGIAAQNLHWKSDGAFTGEVSGPFLKDAGAEYVIIGHSERRQYFGETDESINLKIKSALQAGLIPIFCIGETLEERESNLVESVLRNQILTAMDGLAPSEVEDLVVAYEPVWAIGTGKTALPEQVEETHAFIRSVIMSQFGNVAEKIRIQYGGSVKPSNSKELLSLPNVDGALIGGASLKASDFIQIIASII